MAWTPKPTQIKNKKTEVPKSYSILIPHRKGEGARGKGGPWGRGRHPQPSGTSPPLNSCPKWDKPGAMAFKNSPHPILSKPKRKKISLSPPNLNIYIYFLKKNKNSKALSVKVNLEQGNVKFPPSFTLTVGFIGTSPAEEPAPRGWQRGRTKGSKGWGPPQLISSQYGRVDMVPGKPHPLGIFQVGWGVGKMHSCVVFSQFQVK